LEDTRGKTGNHKTSQEKLKAIKDHINSFPRYVSHYRRETSAALYLDPNLNLSILYRLFKDSWTISNQNEKPPSASTYERVFKTLGLKFKALKSDTCKTCDKFGMQLKLDETNKEEVGEKRSQHWDQAAALQGQMKHDFDTGKNDERVQGIVYDLEKTFTLPKSPSNVFYYTRNLNVFNLGIHDGKTDKGYFHVWIENEAGRGGQEVASCILKFLGIHLEEKAEELIMWSDSCGGQNRNHLMCLILHHFLAGQNTLKRIVLRFLQSGHSFNQCDRDFASVENVVRRQQSIFTPTEIIEIMKTARVEKPFEVSRMKGKDFFSAEKLLQNITKREKDMETGYKVSWLETHEIVLSREYPFYLYLNYDVTENKFFTLNYTKTSKGEVTSEDWKKIELSLSNPEGRKLSKEKIKDFRKHFDLYPPYAIEFFNSITMPEVKILLMISKVSVPMIS
jgi:hypothetical protein